MHVLWSPKRNIVHSISSHTYVFMGLKCNNTPPQHSHFNAPPQYSFCLILKQAGCAFESMDTVALSLSVQGDYTLHLFHKAMTFSTFDILVS